jgi:peptide/nickel transport system substrate-binding protein
VRAAVLWLTLALAAQAHGETRAAYGGAAQAALPSALATFDPLRGGLGDLEVAALIFDAPYALDAAGRPRKQLALALDNPSGALRARLTVRGDLRFSDGTPLTAHDVAASLMRALREPGGWMLGPLKAARALGDDQVELELSRETPELPLLLATRAAAITPGGAAPGKRPVGSGPFVVEALDAQAVRLGPNPSCFAGRAYLQSLTLRSFGARSEETGSFAVGALQALRHAPPAFPRRAAVERDGAQTITGVIAVGRGPDAERLRRVLSLALNRERLRRAVGESAVVAADGVPPALRPQASAPLKPAYDPARARAEVTQRWPGAPPHLGLLIDASRFDDRDLAERILADLGRVGIEIAIESVDAAQYQARLESGRYDLALGAVAPPAPDAGLASLAALALVDPAAARAALASAPAPVSLEGTRVVPLFHRTARLWHVAELHGLELDGAGRASWADAWWSGR